MAKIKMKTKRGAAKRFKVKASGKITKKRANRNHILTKHTAKKKLQRRANDEMRECDAKLVKRMLRVL